jgi:hypothetical protein
MSEKSSLNEPKTREKNLTTIALILMLSTSMIIAGTSIAQAATTITASAHFNQFIGQNSETLIVYTLSPNILSDDPNYAGKTSAWPNAQITFTRPDGTKDIVNGPITVEPAVPQGVAVDRFTVRYTPNTQGNWIVNLYWPGDTTYNPVNQTDTFHVGQPIPRRNTYAMLSFNPYPTVGVGQNLLINAWITPPPLTNYQAYADYMFTFTAPDGTTIPIGPVNSEAPGTIWFDMPLTQIGTWSVKFDFPGDYASLPSSVTRTITVQQQPVTIGYPDTPLPTEPWTFPINTNNREWRTIAGEWTQAYYNASMGSYNPYTEAPKTAHILWKLPAYSGVGGYVGSPHSIQTGAQVEGEVGDVGVFSSSVPTIRTIMAGRGYYTAGGSIVCVDMQTGNQLWSVPGTFDDGATRGRVPALYDFGSRFIAYSGLDGSVLLNVTGMSVNFFADPYAYTYQRTNSATGEGYLIKWDTSSSSSNFASRIVWNETNVLPYTTTSHCLIQGNLMIARHFLTQGVQNYGVSTSNTVIVDYITAVNLTTGKMEWNSTIANPSDPSTWLYRQGPAWGSGNGLVYFAGYGDPNEGMGYVAFNAATGNLQWWSEESDYPWGNFWAYTPQACTEDLIIGLGYNGVYGFDVTNGKIVWHYVDNNTYNEEPYGSNVAPDGSPYSSYSFGSTGPVVGGGIIFAPNTEHSPTFAYRGMGLDAIDAATGQQVWRILGAYYTPTAIAYGVLLASDSWNGFTYAFGKGTTTTTVATSSTVLPIGNSVLLQGTVMDMSSAQNGTAAIADADQEAWMEYLHMQQPKPTDANGVQVHLTALDANGNIQEIGTVTSDATGMYSIGWTPPIEGKYTVYASFEGSDAYYGSQAETAMLVTPAAVSPIVTPTLTPPTPTTTPTTPTPAQTSTPTSPVTSPTPAVQPPTSGMPIATYIAIAVAVVIIVVAAAAIVLRRRRQ